MLYLASQSPRRRQLLEQLGMSFNVLDVEVPEVRAVDEPAHDYISRVAREKAGAGLLQVIGNAGATTVRVRGQAVDLVGITRNNVARFEVK